MSTEPGGAFEAPGYEIRDRIGGSQGADVYLAEQRALGRRVALKVLRGASADPEQLARFEFETRTAAALLHPHIVPLLDSGTTPDGRSYYAMPYLEAGDLTRRIPLGADEARRVAIALCDALWYAHGRNVVHRDIKPSNVLFDDGGRPMLADFGIATTIVGTRGLTVPGRVLGAARYISPEQARGEKVDPRADLYSLGIVIFEMLTGTVPYTATDDVTLALQHAEAPVPRLAAPFASWQAFFDRALAKAPNDRFMSARTMAQALESIGTAAGSPAAVVVPLPGPAAAAATGAVAAAVIGDDDLPRLHAEAPSYVRPGAPAPRASRAAPIAALLGVVALAAVIGYRLTRDPDETFDPMVVEGATEDAAPAPTVVDPPPPAEPVREAAATSEPAQRASATPTRRAAAPAAASSGEDADGPDLAGVGGADASDEDISDIPGPDDPAPADAARNRGASDRIGSRDDADDAFDDESVDGDIEGTDDERSAGDPRGDGGDAFDDERDGDGRDDGTDYSDSSDHSDDPAFAPGSWSPPLPQPELSGSPDTQLREIDRFIDDARSWLEDERQRVEQLQQTSSPESADRELESFEADEQAFERWLDRVEALRSRIERDAR